MKSCRGFGVSERRYVARFVAMKERETPLPWQGCPTLRGDTSAKVPVRFRGNLNVGALFTRERVQLQGSCGSPLVNYRSSPRGPVSERAQIWVRGLRPPHVQMGIHYHIPGIGRSMCMCMCIHLHHVHDATSILWPANWPPRSTDIPPCSPHRAIVCRASANHARPRRVGGELI